MYAGHEVLIALATSGRLQVEDALQVVRDSDQLLSGRQDELSRGQAVDTILDVHLYPALLAQGAPPEGG